MLNDIGPAIDYKGLMRIKSYVESLHDAADVLRQLFAGQFPNLSDDDWVAFARRTLRSPIHRRLRTVGVISIT